MFENQNVYIVFVIVMNTCLGFDDYLKEKPRDIGECQIAKPEFVQCSTKSVQQLFAKLVVGFKELNNLPPIDPMSINEISLLQGNGPVSINATLTDVTVRGFDRVKVIESQVNSKDYSWITIFDLPKMRIDAQYDIKGKILIIPLVGHGDLWLEPQNMHIIMHTKTRLYEKFGHTFYNVTSTKVDYDLTGLKLRLNNLFDGLKALEESTNKFMNDNWKLASDSLKPIIAKTIEDIMLDILRKIFHLLPADYLITDISKPSELYGHQN